MKKKKHRSKVPCKYAFMESAGKALGKSAPCMLNTVEFTTLNTVVVNYCSHLDFVGDSSDDLFIHFSYKVA
jgi:hypothetical protein